MSRSTFLKDALLCPIHFVEDTMEAIAKTTSLIVAVEAFAKVTAFRPLRHVNKVAEQLVETNLLSSPPPS
jgi:hypothetical protein